MKKVLFTATVDSHILHFHIPYLKWFKEQGYEVHVATNGDEKIPYCDIKHVVSFERSPIKINNIKAINQLKKIIKQEKFDIIHCHTPMGSVITRIAARKSRKNGTRVIYTAHGFHFYKGASLLNWLFFYPIEKILSYITDDLITINSEDYELAKKKFYAKRTHYVLGVGVDFEKFNIKITEKEKNDLKENLEIKNNEFIIIFPAELSKRKNQEMLLKTINRLGKEGYKNIKVLLPGTDSMNGKYQQMAKRLKIEEQIKFLGYRKDIPKLMQISDLAVSTSRQEGLPVNLMEAMMLELPIIATNCRGNRDIANKLVEIDNIEELSNNIKQCIKNKDLFLCTRNSDYELNNILKRMKKIYKNEK